MLRFRSKRDVHVKWHDGFDCCKFIVDDSTELEHVLRCWWVSTVWELNGECLPLRPARKCWLVFSRCLFFMQWLSVLVTWFLTTFFLIEKKNTGSNIWQPFLNCTCANLKMLLQSIELCCLLGILLKTQAGNLRLKHDRFTVWWYGTQKAVQPHAFYE